jgi:hypothetical protein
MLRLDFEAAAWRKPQTVRARLSSPAFAFATMPWKYPPGVDRKCSAGFAETMARDGDDRHGNGGRWAKAHRPLAVSYAASSAAFSFRSVQTIRPDTLS